MPNEYVNEVIFGNETIMSVKDDTVTPQTLLSGATAHDRSGAPIVGTATQGHIVQNSSGTNMTQRRNIKFVNATVSDDSENDTTVVNMSGAIIDNELSTTSENPVQNKVITGELDKAYKDDDTAETDIANDDYVPFYDTSASTKKKSLWSNIINKIKTALGISSSGDTYLKKDGTWGTPTNTTYTFATGDSDGQIKVTPSGGTAQNVSVKGLGSAAYTASTAYAVSKALTNEDLNNVTTPGFYNAGGSNTCTNTPYDSVTAFGLQVIHTAAGNYYTQLINANSTAIVYRRICGNGTWSAWTQDNYTNTWRGIQNNLTSTSTTDSLSANQGRLLANGSARDSTKLPLAGGTMTGVLTINKKDGTTSAIGYSGIILGNSTKSGTAENSKGYIRLYSEGSGYMDIRSAATHDGNYILSYQSKSGTIALTSDLPTNQAAASGGTANSLVTTGDKYNWNNKVNKTGDTMTGNLVTYGKLISYRNDGLNDCIEANTKNGTTSKTGVSQIVSGNNLATGTDENSIGALVLFSANTNYVGLRAGSGTSGNVYLPAGKDGQIVATTATSSYRVKENIRDMTDEEALKILDVEVVKFDYKEEFGGKTNQSGVIAEEVKEIIPEVVDISEFYDETKAIDPASNPSPIVDYGKFAPYLIKMIQIQQEKIEALERRIETLENNK